MTLILQCNLNTAHKCIHNLLFCPLFIFRIYDIPRRSRHIGIFHITVNHIFTFFVMLVLPFIRSGHTPLCIFFIQKFFHAFFLFALIDLHKKFQHKVTVVCQLAFKPTDTFNSFFIQIPLQVTCKNIHDRLLHPA